MKRFLNFILKINFKTFYFNFKYLPLKQAVKLPIFISRKVYLKNSGGKIIIDAIAIRTGLIQFGYGEVGIFDNKKSRSIWDVSGIVTFKGICRIGHGSKISVGENGKLTLGNNFVISAETSIVSHIEIVFGNNCLLSWDILIMDTDFHKIKDKQENIINAPKPIIIGENVWIGCRSLILKGTIIANHSVIGANSIVSKPLEYPHGLYAGNPCKLIKENISWEE